MNDRIYYNQLDALRFYSVMWVVFAHLPIISLNPALREFFYFLPGVPLFFGISGFLITGIILQNSDSEDFFKSFYIRRFLRIFPIYYLAIFLLFFLNPNQYRDNWFIYDLFYLSNFKVGLLGSFDFNSVSPHFWSLAVEEQFYLIWPFLLFFIKLKINKFISAIMFCLIGSALLVFFDSFFISRTFGNFSYLGIGCLISIIKFYNGGWLIKHKNTITIFFYIILSLVITTCFIGFNFESKTRLLVSLICLTIVLLKFILGFESRLAKSVLENFCVAYIGKISYGIYLYHLFAIFPLIFISKYLIGINISNIHLLAALKILITLVISVISWEFFEKKINGLKDRFKY